MATLKEIPVITREYYRVPVTVKVLGAPIDPTGNDVEWAVIDASLARDPIEAEWAAGIWETYPGPSYIAAVLVGDVTTTFPLDVGVTYDAWWRMTDTPERPARKAGQIKGT